jgi:hypothetical protein
MNTQVKPPGGRSANILGKMEEDRVAAWLTAQGYQYVGNPDHLSIVKALNAGADMKHLAKPGFFYRQLPAYRSIFGTPFKADFIIRPFSNADLVLIELKSQTSTGSVDEKLPFWLMSLSAIAAQNVTPVLAVLGDGARPGSIQWCRDNKGPVHVFADSRSIKTFLATIK